MFLWRTDKNYPWINIKYPSYLFHCSLLYFSMYCQFPQDKFNLFSWSLVSYLLVFNATVEQVLSMHSLVSDIFKQVFILFYQYTSFLLYLSSLAKQMSNYMTKPTKWHVRPAKTQINLGIHPVWSESSLCSRWVAKNPSFIHADSKDSDQTGWMPRLIWVFAGRMLILLVFSCCGSIIG